MQLGKAEMLAAEEMNGVFDLLPRMQEFGMQAGILRAGGKIVAFSAGEVCGDTLYVHVEKALRGVQGAYPAIAQMFAQTFARGVTYINREDDSGDAGLRKSKMQYSPVQLVDKYNLAIHRSFDALSVYPEIPTPRLVLRAIADEDARNLRGSPRTTCSTVIGGTTGGKRKGRKPARVLVFGGRAQGFQAKKTNFRWACTLRASWWEKWFCTISATRRKRRSGCAFSPNGRAKALRGKRSFL